MSDQQGQARKEQREKELEALRVLEAEATAARDANRTLREACRDDAELQKSTREALVADLLRVFNDIANPYRGYAASRQRYRKLGHYPELLVTDFFGNHEEFQRAAGLRDSRTTAKVRNKAANLHTHQQIAEYADEHLLARVGQYDNTAGLEKKGRVDVVIGSDFHSEFLDPFAFEVFLEAIRMVRPEIVVINGDAADFPQISRHRKMPGHFHLNLHDERRAVQEIFRRIREAAGDEATLYFVIGNHEYRLVTYLADCAPAMAALPELGFANFFGLDEHRISLVTQSSFLAPTAAARKGDVRRNWVTLFDCFVATHGTSCAKVASLVELEGAFKMSGTSGHTHRPQIMHSNSLGTGAISWMSTPMLAGFAVGRDYVSNPSQWNMGFGVVSIEPSKKLVTQQLVIVHENWATFGGRTWVPTKKALKRRQQQWSVGGRSEAI